MKRMDGDHIRAKKSLGQNFLTDSNYIARIVAAAEPVSGDTIIEIGPGRGALTERLLQAGVTVIAVELDRNLIAPLRTAFKGSGRFLLVEQDALSVDFGALVGLTPARPERLKLIANLPYYISTAILQHLAAQRSVFSELILMFQREVVARITAPPGTSERGYLTVLTERAFEVKKLFDVPPTAFRPAPKVWSSVARLTPKPPLPDDDAFNRLVSAAFSQKRKTIANNLKPAFPKWAEALRSAGIDPKSRAEELSLDEWERLNRAVIAA